MTAVSGPPADDRPPRDFPDEGSYAVTRSVGSLRVWNDLRWRWDGHDWQPVAVSGPPADDQAARARTSADAETAIRDGLIYEHRRFTDDDLWMVLGELERLNAVCADMNRIRNENHALEAELVAARSENDRLVAAVDAESSAKVSGFLTADVWKLRHDNVVTAVRALADDLPDLLQAYAWSHQDGTWLGYAEFIAGRIRAVLDGDAEAPADGWWTAHRLDVWECDEDDWRWRCSCGTGGFVYVTEQLAQAAADAHAAEPVSVGPTQAPAPVVASSLDAIQPRPEIKVPFADDDFAAVGPAEAAEPARVGACGNVMSWAGYTNVCDLPVRHERSHQMGETTRWSSDRAIREAVERARAGSVTTTPDPAAPRGELQRLREKHREFIDERIAEFAAESNDLDGLFPHRDTTTPADPDPMLTTAAVEPLRQALIDAYRRNDLIPAGFVVEALVQAVLNANWRPAR